MVQLSHPYTTTGKTIALTIWTFVGKVMFLLFNMLSCHSFYPRGKCLLISWLRSPSTVYSVLSNSLWSVLSWLLINFLATGKTLDSSLHPYQELRPIGETVLRLSFCWQFIVFSHGKRDQEALWGTSFISTLMPFMTAPLLWPNHLLKAPPPNIITLRVKVSTQGFWGYIIIDTTTIGRKQ